MTNKVQVDALAELEKLNITHGDIRPELIFVKGNIENNSLQFKLLDRVNEQGSALNSQMNYLVSSNNLYLSPSYYDSLSNGKMKTLGADAFR